MRDLWNTFDFSLPVIPTWSVMPMKYLPMFSPLCLPETPQNPMTADLNFQHPSTTLIQCAVIPRNAWPVLSVVQPSAVIDTLPDNGDCVINGESCFYFAIVSDSTCSKGGLQFLKLLNKLVVDVDPHLMSTWKFSAHHFRSHYYKAVSKCHLVCHCKCLSVKYQHHSISPCRICNIPGHYTRQTVPPHGVYYPI